MTLMRFAAIHPLPRMALSAADGTSLPRANVAACPHPAEEDMRALA
jgi:hypothetical protein